MSKFSRPSRWPSPRSLVSRLLLAAAPVCVVVVLLVGWVAVPLVRTPGELARAQHDLVEVQRYQSLLSLVDEQALHWAEYQYLTRGELGLLRSEMAKSSSRIAALREEWADAPKPARVAFEAYDRADRIVQTSLANVEVGRDQLALDVLVEQVLPLTHQTSRDLDGVLLERSERLGETFAELAGNVRASFLGASLAADLTTVRYEMAQMVGVAGVQGLVVREAGQYAEVIASGGSPDPGADGVAAVVERELARLGRLVDVVAEPHERGILTDLDRLHGQLAQLGREVDVLVSTGHRDRAGLLFEDRLDPILDKQLLPLVSATDGDDRRQLRVRFAAVDSRMNRLRTEIAAGGVLMVLILLLPIVLIGRSTVRPLRRIRRAADEVGAGNLGARSGVTGTSEVGELALAFDTMAARVQESRASLMSTAVLEAASDLLLVVQNGVVSYASGASRALLGRPPESLAVPQ